MSYNKQRLQISIRLQIKIRIAGGVLLNSCYKLDVLFIISVTFTIILVKKSKVHFTGKYVKV